MNLKPNPDFQHKQPIEESVDYMPNKQQLSILALQASLRNFYNAAVNVSRAWEQITDNEVYIDDPTGAYPFDESFEDLLPQIGKWVQAVDAELKENYPPEEKTK